MLHMWSTSALVLGFLSGLSAAFYPLQAASYELVQDYSGKAFFENFEFYHDLDPTMGHVQYVDLTTANSTSLAGFLPQLLPLNSSSPPPVFLGVDATNQSPHGRTSTRVYSKQTFNRALIIADILHMPAPQNRYTLHTTDGISITKNSTVLGDIGPGMRGNMLTYNCDVNAPGQDRNAGCTVADFNGSLSYGNAFNNNSGGVFATLFDDSGVRIWFFDRLHIPADILAGTPYPPHIGNSTVQTQTSYWGYPNARFTGPDPSAFSQHFRDMQIIFNTGFCGEWAGKAWSNNPTCSKLAPTCEDYVSNHPEAFQDVYWAIQNVKVYELKTKQNSTDLFPALRPTSISSYHVATPASEGLSAAKRAYRDAPIRVDGRYKGPGHFVEN